MYQFIKDLKEYIIIMNEDKYQKFKLKDFEYNVSKELGIEGEEQVILYGKNKKVKYVVIKSFETREEAQKKIDELNSEFNSSLIIVKNSEEEIEII